jgi:hypothetical protein
MAISVDIPWAMQMDWMSEIFISLRAGVKAWYGSCSFKNAPDAGKEGSRLLFFRHQSKKSFKMKKVK